ncbi:META domain-containing protein [Hymenobacter sp.]|uniref:META domain-containing protein n=1 Tax=Hymenobacter sp. TaxID=1898978 RepID=UPI00286A59D3|nr:META domain-containing protein [Hymenobacter sp.]
MGITLLLGGCREKCEDPAPDLIRKRWMVQQVDGAAIMLSSYSHDYNSFIEFSAQGNKVLGLAACSSIKGKFTLGAGSQQISFTQLTSTPGNCSDLNFARNYLAALPQTKRYQIQGSQLLLYDDDNLAAKPRLVFEAAK